jgi:hypothetical protein
MVRADPVSEPRDHFSVATALQNSQQNQALEHLRTLLQNSANSSLISRIGFVKIATVLFLPKTGNDNPEH